MSKSLARVRLALAEAGLPDSIMEMAAETRTAQQAADAAGCALDQIAKSIIFRGAQTGRAILFLTAGGNQVDPEAASGVAGEPLARADGAFVRSQTGFAIGGVSPLGHLTPSPTFWDPRLDDFALIYAAAGTPRHIFSIEPKTLQPLCKAQSASFTA